MFRLFIAFNMVSEKGNNKTLDTSLGEAQIETKPLYHCCGHHHRRHHGKTPPSDSEDVGNQFGATIGASHIAQHQVQSSHATSLTPHTTVDTFMNQPIFFPPSSQIQPPYPSDNPHLHAPPLPSVYKRPLIHESLPFHVLQQQHIHGLEMIEGILSSVLKLVNPWHSLNRLNYRCIQRTW